MWQWLLSILLVIHGLIHLLGVVAYWQLATLEGLRYPSTLLGGWLAAPTPLVRVLGVLWLAGAIGFAAAAAGQVVGQAWWLPLLVGMALLSLILCALAWPDAWAGAVINVMLLAAVLGLRLLSPAAA